MESTAIDLVATTDGISIWSLFWQSDLLIKAIMLALVVCSIWSWAIIFDKWLSLSNLKRKARQFEDRFWSGDPLDKLFEAIGSKPRHPMEAVFLAGMREWRRAKKSGKSTTKDASLRARLLDRIERTMGLTIDREMERAERHMVFLSSLGAVAPFVGLFGTVWGIIHSFSALAGATSAAISAIAPGMAEALFTTAMGLVAAIPAVIAYNKYANDLARYSAKLEGFSTEFLAILARYMEEA